MPDFPKARVRSDKAGEGQDPLPLFGRWRNAYFAVVVVFILEVAFFYFVGRYFL